MLAYIGLGTNLGNKVQNLTEAIRQLNILAGCVIRQSSVYVSEPWGFKSENDFRNMAVALETNLSPMELLHATQQIEKEMGRTHKSVNGCYTDRIIDIDILLYGNEEIHLPELTIPHPLIEQRDFVRIPLNEIKE